MSSKLVKQQLNAVLGSGVAKPKGAQQQQQKKRSKAERKRRKVQAALAAADPAAAAEEAKAVVEANLRYFQRTTKPSEATQELLAKVSKHKGPEQDKEEEEDDFDDFGDLDGLF